MSQPKTKTKKNNPIFWDNLRPPVAVAHRGGNLAGFDKENSLKAFKRAYDDGFKWFETDVVTTRDGVLLAIHGRGYQRHPNKDLPSRIKIQFITYEHAKKHIKVGGEEVATLEELLDNFPDANFFVDPKTVKTAPVLAKFLQKRQGDIDRVWVGSFIPFSNSIIYKHLKKVTGKEVGLGLLGPIKALPIKLGCMRWFPLGKLLAKTYVPLSRAGSLAVPYSWVANDNGRELVRFAHEMELKVGVYTPNNKKDIKECVQKGVDFVITDNLKDLQSVNIRK